ncbi:polyprenyl synthetase family protein [Oceanivirga miroungae]|uniref:Polyprenyl synthetase n=1 Tax=Oceanivirga miroungae TaxID=1130046 RepID=A0A6I8MCF2_9FUSO|nr:polyprenyl synthetase family protein [Oceanivirga miroungae]VWL84789.1 polyprenyl synthetase [Oceanivirga miroungae]
MLSYFESELQKYIKSYDKNKFSEAIDYILSNGGKRIRPQLILNLAKSLNKNYKEVIDLAIAIELIHTYSLIHDDLPCMDNDDYRRGKLTLHKKYNEYTALLVGCALLTDAFNVIAKSKTLKNKDKIISFISEKIGAKGMIMGQFLDMEYENKEIDEKTLKIIHKKKTAELIKASLIATLINFDIYNEKYEKIAENLGLIYQIQDDIFDYDTFDNSNYARIIGLDKAKKEILDLKEEIYYLLSDNKEFLEYIDKIINRSY